MEPPNGWRRIVPPALIPRHLNGNMFKAHLYFFTGRDGRGAFAALEFDESVLERRRYGLRQADCIELALGVLEVKDHRTAGNA